VLPTEKKNKTQAYAETASREDVSFRQVKRSERHPAIMKKRTVENDPHFKKKNRVTQGKYENRKEKTNGNLEIKKKTRERKKNRRKGVIQGWCRATKGGLESSRSGLVRGKWIRGGKGR